MKTAFIFILGSALLGCGPIILRTSNDTPEESSAADDAPQGRLGSGPGKVCDASARSGLSVSLLFEPGSRPKAELILTGSQGPEELESFEDKLEGWRIQEASQIKVRFVQQYFGATEKVGDFNLELRIDGKAVAKKSFTLQSDGCHVIPQSFDFEVPATAPIPLAADKEYYPVDGNRLIAVTANSKQAQDVISGETFQAVEVIRWLQEQTSSGTGADASVSVATRLEKEPSGKIRIGGFYERGIDRGALPSSSIKDTGMRMLFGQASGT